MKLKQLVMVGVLIMALYYLFVHPLKQKSEPQKPKPIPVYTPYERCGTGDEQFCKLHGIKWTQKYLTLEQAKKHCNGMKDCKGVGCDGANVWCHPLVKHPDKLDILTAAVDAGGKDGRYGEYRNMGNVHTMEMKTPEKKTSVMQDAIDIHILKT